MKKLILLILISATLVLSNSCEDELPLAYEQRYIIEAFVIGEQPIEDLRIVRSLPINEPYDYSDALVRDAQVRVREVGGEWMQLAIADSGETGWYYPDTTYKVKPNTQYELEVSFSDGKFATGTASVPDTFSWTKKLPDYVTYPSDEEIATTEVEFAWTPTLGFYLLRSWAMDTLDYGSYLEEPADVPNQRIPNEFRNEGSYDNVTTWGFLPSNEAVVVWGAFRWFGRHEVSIYNSDFNMLRWFAQARGSQQYNELLNTIEGDAIGCFGGATVIRDTSMLLFPPDL